MITLYRGDDTGGQLGKEVKIAFHCDDAVDMDGVTVRFNLLNVITKEWTNVHDGDILEMFVTHEQSGRLPLGFLFGKIWGEDSSGKVRTFANRLPIIVTHDLRKVYGSDGLDSQDIHVYSSVDWDAVANKPTLFPSKVDMVEGLEEALKKVGSVKTVNSVEPDGNGNIALDAKDVGAVPGLVKETGVVIPVPEGAVLTIKGKGEYYPSVLLEREDGMSVWLADIEEVDAAIATHNTDTFAHSGKFALYAPKTTVYTKGEVDSKINQFAAHYLTADADGSAFATVEALKSATAYYYAGVAVDPTKNDYAIVLNDDGKTARWAFFGEGEEGVWQRQYYISSISFTADQWAAINSGIKDYLVPKILTIDESTTTKKIALGDKVFTSFAELTELVQNGVTRLKYYVTNAASRPVLYTAHLCDASAIRFDATGYIGTQIFTRSIVIENVKDGTGRLTDRIAVTVGTLTEIAKASELAGKLDVYGLDTAPYAFLNKLWFSSSGESSDYSLGVIPDFGFCFTDDVGSVIKIPLDGSGGQSGTLALLSDVATATNLTPVWEFSNVPDNLRAMMPFRMVFEPDRMWVLYAADEDYPIDGMSGTGSETVVDFADGESETGSGIIATIVGYKTAKDEELMAGGADAKAALFAGEAFKKAVADCFDNADTTSY